MKKSIFILSCVLFLMSCSKNNLTIDKAIKKEIHTNGSREWIVDYRYENDKLVSVEDFNPNIGLDYTIEYENDRVSEIKLYNRQDNKLWRKEAYIYNDDGSIQKINYYGFNPDNELQLYVIYEMEYNKDGLVTKVSEMSTITNEEIKRTEIKWTRGNATEVKYYRDGELKIKFSHKYDNKINYKKDLPTYFKTPEFRSINNIKKTNAKDYTSLIDWECMPCEMNLEYNSSDLLERLENVDSEYIIDYEYE